MVHALFDYVHKLREHGHSRSFIRAHLSRSGYSPLVVNEVLNPSFPAVQHVRMNYFFVALIVLLVFVVGSLFVWWFFQPARVSIELYALTTAVFPGEQVIFDKVLSSSVEKLPVDVVFELLSDKKAVVERREKLLISGLQRIPSKFFVPNNVKSGEYVLKVSVLFDGKSVSNQFSVTVKESLRPVAQILGNVSQENTKECAKPCIAVVPCTASECVDGGCVSNPIIPCCGNGRCESDESESSCTTDCGVVHSSRESVVESASVLVKKDVAQSILLCNSLIEDDAVDSCLETISKEALSSVVCDSVRSAGRRDSCFMSFALNGDFSVCDKIVDRYQSNSCWYLAQAKEFQSRQSA
ncbi:hypothetical protein HY485_05350 [Candidatus Woesearchaeota archaeon]|nr:hypothetical protein [Candidatus Woesearchaeota archaeon]